MNGDTKTLVEAIGKLSLSSLALLLLALMLWLNHKENTRMNDYLLQQIQSQNQVVRQGQRISTQLYEAQATIAEAVSKDIPELPPIDYEDAPVEVPMPADEFVPEEPLP